MMSRICLFALFLILSIAVRFGNCENNAEDNTNCTESAPGSDKTRLSPFEKIIKWLDRSPLEKIKWLNLQRSSKEELKPLAEEMKLPVEKLELFVKRLFKLPVKSMARDDNGWVLVKGPKPSVDDIMKENRNILRESFSDFLKKLKSHGVIFPGTLWCGGGDIAKNETDLGLFNRTDACCRAHDNCHNDIEAGNTEVNLINNGLFTRSACFCDHEFYNCLKTVDSIISKTIGDTYFNILQPQCFNCICPTDNCQSDDDTACKDHCAKYGWFNNTKF